MRSYAPITGDEAGLARALLDEGLVRIPDLVEDNIASIAQLRVRIEREMTRHQRVIASIAERLGQPITMYLLLAAVAGWVGFNALAIQLGWKAIDTPPFLWLQGGVALYSAFMTTLIVVAQHRQRIEADQRAHLELQVNLLAEQKTTKIISLLEELRRDLPDVRDRNDPVADALQQEIDPHAMHSALKR